MIEITSMVAVSVDGTSAGCVVDAFANFPEHRAALQDALMAFEETLRQATTSAVAAGQENTAAVQTLLDTANARIAELETQAAADATSYREGLAAAQASAAASIEQMRASSQAQVDSTVATANASIAAAQVAVTAAQTKQALAEACEQACSNLASILMTKGESAAAVAAAQEVARTAKVRELADLQAKIAALPQD